MPQDRLATLLDMQRTLQVGHMGADPQELTGEERADFFRTHSFALLTELTEASEEVGWKPWAKGKKARFMNREAYLKELVDAFHFWMNLWLLAGGTAGDLYQMYREKNAVNTQRQIEGYDAVTTKCRNPDCRRALDDYGHTKVATPEGEFHSFECWGDFTDKADSDA